MKKILIFAALAVIIIGLALVILIQPTGNIIQENRDSPLNVKEFTLKAYRFYYEPETISVNNGDLVRIKIENVDTLHGIRLPEFGVKDNNQVEFVANRTGEFDFYCTVYCGEEHKEMKGRLIIT